MSKAISYEKRVALISLYESNESYASICAQLGISERGAKHLISLWKQSGKVSVPSADYSLCGKRVTKFSIFIRDKAILLKKEHPRWGAGLIVAKLKEEFSNWEHPSESTVLNWFKEAKFNKKKQAERPQEK